MFRTIATVFSKIAKILIVIVLGVAGLIGWAASSNSVPFEEIHFYERFQARAVKEWPAEINVATYNIGYGSGRKNNLPETLTEQEVKKNLDAMVSALEGVAPDIVFLQEVDFNSARTFGINQLEYLAKQLQFPYAASLVTWNKRYVAWPYWPPKVHFGRMLSGQAVLSRFPIVKQETFRFPKPDANSFWYNWFYLDRILQKVTLQIGDTESLVWNIHLEAFDQKTRTEQLSLLNQRVKETKQSIFVAGDFNEDPQDLFPTFFKISYPSFSSWEPKESIDHIFAASELHLLDSGVLSLEASDHLPLWARFEKGVRAESAWLPLGKGP